MRGWKERSRSIKAVDGIARACELWLRNTKRDLMHLSCGKGDAEVKHARCASSGHFRRTTVLTAIYYVHAVESACSDHCFLVISTQAFQTSTGKNEASLGDWKTNALTVTVL